MYAKIEFKNKLKCNIFRDILFPRSKFLCNFTCILCFLLFSCLVFITVLHEYLWYDKKKSEQNSHLPPIFTFFVRVGWIVPFPITFHVLTHLSPCMKYCGFYIQAGNFQLMKLNPNPNSKHLFLTIWCRFKFETW